MKDVREDLVVSAKLGHRLFDITVQNTDSVGHGLMAGLFNVCLLAKASPMEVPVEDLITMLRHAFDLVTEADADAATSREAAKYGIQ
jgi:hypothetical protein